MKLYLEAQLDYLEVDLPKCCIDLDEDYDIVYDAIERTLLKMSPAEIISLLDIIYVQEV